MGIVYEGHSPGDNDPVAIKVFYPDTKLSTDETSVLLERFQREGSALSQLDHRNVVSVKEVGTEQDFDFIVMEKIEGFNLKELLTMGTRFTLAETFDIILQLLGRPDRLPPGRCRPPGCQAGERSPRPGRHDQADGLRHRPGGHRRDPDQDWYHRWDAELHEP